MKQVVIIGGGASGPTAAITAARNGKDVTIMKKIAHVEKKFLLPEMVGVIFGIKTKI